MGVWTRSASFLRSRLLHGHLQDGRRRLLTSDSGVPLPMDALLICNISASRGTSPIVVALLDYLQQKYSNVGYYVPIAKCRGDDSGISARVDLVRGALNLDDEAAAMQGVRKAEALDMISRGEEEALGEKIYARYVEYKRRYGKEITVIEGGLLEGLSSSIVLNAWLANELSAPMLMLYDCQNDPSLSDPEDIMRRVSIAKKDVESHNAELAGLILNRVPQKLVGFVSDQLRRAAKEHHCSFAGAFPNDQILERPRLNEVVRDLDGCLLFGDAIDADVDVSTLLVAAQNVTSLLSKIRSLVTEGSNVSLRPLVLTTPDRSDVLLSLGCLHASKVRPRDWPGVAGVLLCDYDGESALDGHVRTALESLDHVFPVIGTSLDVGQAIQALARSGQSSKILATSATKLERAKLLFKQHIDMDVIAGQLSNPKRDGKTPKQFLHGMYEVCRRQPKRIVLPESEDPRILRAAAEVTSKGLADILLLGDEAQVRADAARLNIDISACEIMDFRHEEALKDEFARIWTEERSGKGATYDQSVDMMLDRNVFGTMLCKTRRVDGMVAGAACTTAATIRPALTVLRKGLVSSVFLMCMPDRVLVFGDCAVVVNPDPKQLAQIAVDAAQTASAFGIEPALAMISYSTGSSGSGPSVDKVVQATSNIRATHPELMVEGPIQYDAAINEVVAKQKLQNSEVAGRATVLIFENLSTGNAVYKAVQQSSKALAIGPLLQGLTRPVNDLSRGATVADIVNTICATALQAMNESK
jgi:phosphate acetyltransferase